MVLRWWWRFVVWCSERWLSLLVDNRKVVWCRRREGQFRVKKVVGVFGYEGKLETLQVCLLHRRAAAV